MRLPKLFEKRITKEKIRNDFAFLIDEFEYELLEVEEPGINDILVFHYRSKNLNDIRICRDRGYYELTMKNNDEYENIAYENEGNIKMYQEYFGKNGYEILVQKARMYVNREFEKINGVI